MVFSRGGFIPPLFLTVTGKRAGVDRVGNNGIINSGSDVTMNRREKNTGVFANLPVPMQLRYVKRIARKYDIDLSGLRIRIDKNPDNIGSGITGVSNPARIGEIILEPDAFTSEEELARTLFHEKVHVEQFRQYGGTHVMENHTFFENEAYTLEEERFGKRS